MCQNTLRVTLIDWVKTAETDKNPLLTIMKKEVLSPVDLDEATKKAESKNLEIIQKAKEAEIHIDQVEQSKIDEISMIQLTWRSADELNKITFQQIQNEYKVFAMKCQADVQKMKENAKAEKQIELEKVQAEFTTNGGDSNGSTTMNGNDIPKDIIDKAAAEAIEATKVQHNYELEQLRKGFI